MADRRDDETDETDDTAIRLAASFGGCLPTTIAILLALMVCRHWWSIGVAIERWLAP